MSNQFIYVLNKNYNSIVLGFNDVKYKYLYKHICYVFNVAYSGTYEG